MSRTEARPERLHERLLRATSFRLAVAQTAIFVALFGLCGGAGLLALRQADARALEAGIGAQLDRLREVHDRAGVTGLARAIDVLQHDTDDWELRLSDGSGRRLAGDLPDARWPDGLADRTLVEGDRADELPETIRAETAVLPGGLRLTVGRDLGPRRAADALEGAVLAGVLALATAVGLGLGVAVSQRGLRRVDEMRAAVAAYAAGDRAARAPVAVRGRSDLDGLALALNGLLDRTTALTEGLRRVSASIAHDLRRPLAHHNQEIARALARPADADALRSALAQASTRVTEVLSLFQAMLQLAELEAGAPGLPRTRIDLYAVAARVAEAYAPGAQDGGRTLALFGEPGALVTAEDRLLGRLIANLVENALTHTPPGAEVELRVEAAGPRLVVRDDGPGVEAGEREAVFQPFHRGDAARATPGSGLGLALVAAATQAFGGRVWAEGAAPGLRVVVDFGAQSK